MVLGQLKNYNRRRMNLDPCFVPYTKINSYEVDFIKIKNFCISKDTIKKNEKRAYRMGKIIVNHLSNKALLLYLI